MKFPVCREDLEMQTTRKSVIAFLLVTATALLAACAGMKEEPERSSEPAAPDKAFELTVSLQQDSQTGR